MNENIVYFELNNESPGIIHKIYKIYCFTR